MVSDKGCEFKELVVDTKSWSETGLSGRDEVVVIEVDVKTVNKDLLEDFTKNGSQLNRTVGGGSVWKFVRFQEHEGF